MKRLLFDLINGIRSGIPVCCTLFFSAWVYFHPGEPCAATVGKARGQDKDARYVQCNRCYHSRKVVQVKPNGVIFKGLIK
jgi:hypothetical protein